ncbi:MAG: molybdenum ABC transporter ATP-binding protein [Gammaproteobacteria bacterium]|nr:molybdenum ABC transporter ATP-binding protein [Gammaproteobacteria bacterium]
MSIETRFRISRSDFALDIDLALPGRDVTAVFGPSGSGKTTFLRAVAGLEHDPDGCVKVGDMLWQDGAHFVPTHERSIGFVFQEASLFSHLDVRRNLEYGLRRVPESARKVSLDRAIELLGIGPLLARRTDGLSGGERQRVAIARALAVSPGILMMDEPLAAVDLGHKQEIMPYLESLHDELDIPVLYVSHAIDEVASLADTLVLLEAGRAVACGPTRELLTRPDLPLLHDPDAEALVETVVAEHDEAFHLTYLDFPGGRFAVTRHSLTVGDVVRLRVLARDVSLTLARPTGTTILNVFPATIEDVVREDPAQVLVRLTAGGITLLSRITARSAAELELKPGRTVYAQVKAVALLT